MEGGRVGVCVIGGVMVVEAGKKKDFAGRRCRCYLFTQEEKIRIGFVLETVGAVVPYSPCWLSPFPSSSYILHTFVPILATGAQVHRCFS